VPGRPRDLLLHRAVLHGDPAGRPRDVLLHGGRVAAVGDDLRRGAPGLAAPAGADVVDLAGAVVVPGLVDAHVHLEQEGATRRRLDVSAAGSAREAADLVAAAARDRPPAGSGDGAVLVARGFRDALWPDAPSRALLDERLPGRAVVLVSADLHTAWCSGAALRRLGVESATGVVREAAAMEVFARAGRVDEAVLDGWVLETTVAAAARGVTAVVDFERGQTPAAWARRAARVPAGGVGDTPGPAVRVRTAVWADRLEEALATGLRSGDRLPGVGGAAADRLAMGPLKVFADGSLGTRTALCSRAYPGAAGPEAHGLLTTPPRELERLLRRASAGGLDVAVHAIGDRAVTLALDAFAAVGCPGRLEHAQQVDRADLPRFAALGVTASVQPRHAVDDRDAADVHWAGATDRAFPYGDLVRAGAALVLGSDAPVAALDPWDAVASAVHRSGDGRPPWHPEQHLDLPTALAAAAGGRRAVRVGDVADLAVLAEEPSAVLAREGADGLRRTRVLGTLLGGAWTSRAPVLG
jgi:predicted amidohydrolase YtcJ